MLGSGNSRQLRVLCEQTCIRSGSLYRWYLKRISWPALTRCLAGALDFIVQEKVFACTPAAQKSSAHIILYPQKGPEQTAR